MTAFEKLVPAQVVAHAGRQGRQVSLTEATTLLGAVDQEAVFTAQRARITHEVWDRKSPINGCSPELILSQPNHNIPGGELYTLRIDGQVVVIQPFAPGIAGFLPMTKTTVDAYAGAHADEIAAGRAHADILRQAVGA